MTIKAMPIWARGLLVLLLLGVGFGVYRLATSRNTTPQYQTATAEKGTLVISVTTSGQIANGQSSPVSTDVTGVVSTVLVKNGDVVHAGQPLAKLDLDLVSKQKFYAATSSYQSAKNSLESANGNLYSLQSTLFSTNQKFINDAVARDLDGSDPTYIQEHATWLAAESSYKNQQNVITQARSNIASAWLSYQQSSPTILAPISGTVTGLSLQPGNVLSVSPAKIANIVTDAKPSLTVNLSDVDVLSLHLGDLATITLDSQPGKTYTGKVISIDRVGTVASNVTSYPVVLSVDSDSNNILSNMNASASIITLTKDGVLLVPSAAIKTQNGQATVQVMNNNIPQSIPVTVGLTNGSQTEILNGVSEGATVVIGTTPPSSSSSTSTGTSVFSRTFGGGGGAIRVGR